ncbi:MAG: STAS domain-containing protein [Clostridia bacterium]|nr:STAS domain-containing protein [Clostridia bacterium]
MKIDKKLDDKTLTVMIEGRLDTNTAGSLANELNSLVGVETLIFDLKDLDYIASAGLRVLLNCQKKMSAQGNMIIKNANDNIKDVFEITGFSDILEIE